MNVYLIRHLATADNEAGIWMGRGIDLPILESQKKGFDERVKRLFSGGVVGKAAIYCSPMKRARMTAVELAGALDLGIEPTIVPELTEDEVGEWEGKSIAETRDSFPQDFERWQKDPANFRFPGGESFMEVQERAFGKLTEIAKREMESGTSNLLVVTHGDPIRLTVCKVMGAAIDSKNEFTVDNGSVTELTFDGERFVVKELNYL